MHLFEKRFSSLVLNAVSSPKTCLPALQLAYASHAPRRRENEAYAADATAPRFILSRTLAPFVNRHALDTQTHTAGAPKSAPDVASQVQLRTLAIWHHFALCASCLTAAPRSSSQPDTTLESHAGSPRRPRRPRPPRPQQFTGVRLPHRPLFSRRRRRPLQDHIGQPRPQLAVGRALERARVAHAGGLRRRRRRLLDDRPRRRRHSGRRPRWPSRRPPRPRRPPRSPRHGYACCCSCAGVLCGSSSACSGPHRRAGLPCRRRGWSRGGGARSGAGMRSRGVPAQKGETKCAI